MIAVDKSLVTAQLEIIRQALNRVQVVIDAATEIVPVPIPPVPEPQPEPVTNYYVALTGNNANSGAIDKPWKTITYAISKVVAGDCINIRAGNYAELVQFLGQKGTQSAPIILKAYPGEVVTVGKGKEFGIKLLGSEWIVVDGIGVTGAIYDGVFISNSNHTNVRNLKVYGNKGVGIHITSQHGSANDNIVRDSEVYDNVQEGIYLDVKTANQAPMERNIIVSNYIHNNGYDGLQNTNQGGAALKPNYTIIKGNRVENHGDWAGCDLGGNGLIIENNIVVNGRSRVGGIYYAQGRDTVIRGNKVTNNYLAETYGDGIVLNNTQNCTVENNVVISTIGASLSGVALLNVNTELVQANNIKKSS